MTTITAEEYLPLVNTIVFTQFSGIPASISRHDLIGGGVLGLMDAIDKYDGEKGCDFTTYAKFRIRGAIVDEVRKIVEHSRSCQDRNAFLLRLCDYAQMVMGEQREAQERADIYVRTRLHMVLSALRERDLRVLKLYYCDELTMKKIGSILSITESCVSKIHNRVINTVRTQMLHLCKREI